MRKLKLSWELVVKRVMTKKVCRLCFALMLSLLLLGAGSVPAWAIDVVVHSTVKTEALKVRELRAIFAMKRQRWPDSKPITVFVLSGDSPLHRQFCKEVLQLFPHQLRSGWDKMVYSGRGSGPMVVNSEEEMVEVLAKTPGAIGYVTDATGFEQIKALEIK